MLLLLAKLQQVRAEARRACEQPCPLLVHEHMTRTPGTVSTAVVGLCSWQLSWLNPYLT
jgi:hypothetical protein